MYGEVPLTNQFSMRRQMRGLNAKQFSKKCENSLVQYHCKCYYRKAVRKNSANNLSADNTHHGVWKCALKRLRHGTLTIQLM